ncbi:hypothetical protein RGL65_004419 [Vibrio parahaemolyticus]|nr:hypothetical protein [Vibrio parahaemolyticus]
MKFELFDGDKTSVVEYDSIEEILENDGFHISLIPARPMIGEKLVFPIDTDAVIQLLSHVRNSYRITDEEVGILKDSFGVSQLEIGAMSLHNAMCSDLGKKPQYYDVNGKRFFIGESVRDIEESYKTSIGFTLNPQDGVVLTRDGVDILSIEGNLVYCDNKCEAESIADFASRKLVKSSMILVNAVESIVRDLDDRDGDVCTHHSIDDLFVVSDVETIRKIEAELSELTQKLRQEAYKSGIFDYSDYVGDVVGLRNDKEHPLLFSTDSFNSRVDSSAIISHTMLTRDKGEHVSLITLDNRTMNAAGAMSKEGIYAKVKNWMSGDEAEAFLKAGSTYRIDNLEKVELRDFVNIKDINSSDFDMDVPF